MLLIMTNYHFIINHFLLLFILHREPLPQYNTESEAVTSRAVLKAGPSQSTRQGGGGEGGALPITDSPPTTAAKDVSFFTFQRGGPGGFSYKIRI